METEEVITYWRWKLSFIEIYFINYIQSDVFLILSTRTYFSVSDSAFLLKCFLIYFTIHICFGHAS